MNQRLKPSMLGLFAGLTAGVVGCQDGRQATYPARGVVRFADGTPVRSGTVEFRSESCGSIARGTVDRDGSFILGTYETADGAVAGPHKVIVVQFVSPAVFNAGKRVDAADAEAHAGHEGANLVAPQFAHYATTPLSAEVTPGTSNHIELEVQPLRRAKPGRP